MMAFLGRSISKSPELRKGIRAISSLQQSLNFINGKRVASDGSSDIAAFDPSKGEVIAKFKNSSSGQVDEAVRAAEAAFQDWSSRSAFERGRVLRNVAALITERCEALAREEVRNNGKAIREARLDIGQCADFFVYYAGLAAVCYGEHIPLGGDNFALTTREPLGVCCGIGAWNYPIQTMSWKVAPALATGNTVLYKPSPFTPMTAPLYAQLLTDAGVPPGAVNVLQGDGSVGAAMIRHPGTHKVSFTGSLPTGQRVMAAAAEGVKPVTLELGGKSPLIVFDDADLGNAIRGAMLANFLTQGEVCSNGTRVFVHRSLLQPFLDGVAERVRAIRVGDPQADDTTMGALINEPHLLRVLHFVQEAKAEGATVLLGGERIERPGYFMTPCVLCDVTDDMRVAREEVFGPVMSVLVFDSEDEVVRRANATPYGLSAGVFTRDLRRAHRVTRQLKAGAQYVNTYGFTTPEVPFGGFKQSGFGRELGTASLHAYTQVKSIIFESGDVDHFF